MLAVTQQSIEFFKEYGVPRKLYTFYFQNTEDQILFKNLFRIFENFILLKTNKILLDEIIEIVKSTDIIMAMIITINEIKVFLSPS